MSLDTVYPTMSSQPAEPVTRMATPDEARASRMYPSMESNPHLTPPAELPANQGFALQAGLKEKAEPAAAGDVIAPSAVPSDTQPSARPPVVTREAIDALLSPEHLEARKADAGSRLYATEHNAALRETNDPQVAAMNSELVAAAFDHGVTGKDFAGLAQLGRKFETSPPDAATVENWRSLTTDAEKQAAASALARNPVLAAVLGATHIIEAPQVIRALARSRR